MKSLGLALTALTILLMGLVMVFNTTAAEMLDKSQGDEVTLSLFKQLAYGGLGAFFAYLVYRTNDQSLFRFIPFAFYGCVILLVLVLIPHVGQKINGARRWIGIGPLSFQPSELMKLLLPAYYIHRVNHASQLRLIDFLKLLFTLGLPIGLILIEPDNGTAAILLVTLVVLFFMTKVKWVYWALPLIVFVTVGALFASQMKHVSDRLRVYLNPEADLLGKGHQPYQAKIAAGSGGLSGKGLGQSLQKLSYLPEARSDYIAAIYAEEFGFLGIFLLLLLYLIFSYFGFRLAADAHTKIGFYLAATYTFLIAFQAFLNLGVVSGLLPSKGTNLPLFSQGGSSLVINMVMIAAILNVAKKQDAKSLAAKQAEAKRLV